MDQQELEPQRSEWPSHNNSDSVQENMQEREARPYYWSTKPNKGNAPKNEHPANFEDSIANLPPIPPYSYQAQDRPAQNTYGSPQAHTDKSAGVFSRQQPRPSGLSPDGDAMEHGYRPHNSYNMQKNQVPPWARPQGGNKGARIAIYVLIGLFFIVPLLKVLVVLFGLLVLFASVALVLLLVIGCFILMGLLIGFILLRRRPSFLRAPWQGRR